MSYLKVLLLGYKEGLSDFGRTYTSTLKNELYDFGRTIKRGGK